MRALPGRAKRTSLGETEPAITRDLVKDAQRLRILRATGELVAKRGYHDVPVELIVKRAKVSFKTFYNHFANKDEAFLALFDLCLERADERVAAALAAEPEAPWPRQVVLAVRAVYELVLEEPIIARAAIVEAPTVGPIMAERYERVMKGLSPLLARGRDFSGERAAELPSTLEDTLAGGVLWSAYQRLIIGEAASIEALLPETVEFALRPYLGEAEASRWAGEAVSVAAD